MATLLNEMRLSEKDTRERNWGKRIYRPDYNLNKHIALPSCDRLRDPIPLHMRVREDGPVYVSTWGVLEPNVKDQFSKHYSWKTCFNRHYDSRFGPPDVPPRPAPCYMHRSERLFMPPTGCKDPNGPYESQKFASKRFACLPENKAWDKVSSYERRFPLNSEPRRDLYREVKMRQPFGRSENDTQNVKRYIRDLIEHNALNSKYEKPLTYYMGFDYSISPEDPLQKPEREDPACMETVYKAQFGRLMPAEEYRAPKHGSVRAIANALPSLARCKPQITCTQAERKHQAWAFTNLDTDHRIANFCFHTHKVWK